MLFLAWNLAPCEDPPYCRRSGLYRFVISMAAAQNAAYGSTLSPPRLQQVRECCQEYWASVSIENGALWSLHAPQIAEQLGVDVTIPGEMAKLYASMKKSALLHKKGDKVTGGKRFPSVFAGIL